MSLLKHYYANFRHPKGRLGKYVVRRMNGKAHKALVEWALTGVDISEDAHTLDIGCGGGATVARMLERCPNGKSYGMDFAPAAIEVARSVNSKAINDGRCKIVGGNAKLLPFIKETIDVATAFETVYYWPAIDECLAEVLRVLKSGGLFIIGNDTDGIAPEGEKWAKLIGHMYIYTIEELTQLLTNAGFTDVTSRHDAETHRICVIGRKP